MNNKRKALRNAYMDNTGNPIYKGEGYHNAYIIWLENMVLLDCRNTKQKNEIDLFNQLKK